MLLEPNIKDVSLNDISISFKLDLTHFLLWSSSGGHVTVPGRLKAHLVLHSD